MRRMIGLLAVLCVVVSAAWADTVILQDDGVVEGTVEEVVFLVQGEPKTLCRGEFTDLVLDTQRADHVALGDGTVEKGEVVSVRLKSVAGLLTFQRAELRSVVLAQRDLDELRKEYLEKRAQIAADDGEELYRLAVWCKEKQLNAEANDLAKLCLKANVSHETATLAHQMLGHVLRGGEWVVPVPTEKPDDDKPAAVAPPRPASEQEQRKADPQAVELARTIAREYEKKAEDAKNADHQAVERTYKGKLDTLLAQIRKLKSDITITGGQLTKLRDDLAAETKRVGTTVPTADQQAKIDQLKRNIETTRNRLQRLEEEYPRVQKEYLVTERQAKAAFSYAASRAANRNHRLATARAKIERLLLLGKTPSAVEMRAIFDEALKDS